ncbi:MAG TPA: ABC transporter permease [Candidatus Limnocylindrales bacterium]|nr:ABC transporter permease [Candidatus Limnocylindrales bacterium]
MTAAEATVRRDGLAAGPAVAAIRRSAWAVSLLVLLAVLLAFTKLIQPSYGAIGIQGLAISVLPLALAAVGQAIVVISGGVDLSIGSMMALTSVVAAALMKGQSEEAGVAIFVGVLVLGLVLGAINGFLVVVTRVPDIVVTLAMSFVWAGFALLVLKTPGGASSAWLKEIIKGSLGNEWIPKAAVGLLVVVAVVWIPLSRSKLGLQIYAIGSDRLAAFRSGVGVGRTRIVAYALLGLFAALGGLSLTASTGIGTPVPGPYTLLSVAAVVLGGVSLAGGVGGVVGPLLAVIILQLIRTDMTFLRVDPNLAVVAQGAILIGVVGLGSLIQLRRSRT